MHDPAASTEAWYAQAVSRKDGITGAMRAKNFSMLDTLDALTVVTGRAAFMRLRDGIWIHPSTSEGLNELIGAARAVSRAAAHASVGG